MEIKRLKLGILFYFSSQWMGGIIYIINVVKTLNFLDDNEKPEIFLFYNPDLKKFLPEFNYPFIRFIEWPFPSIVRGNAISFLVRKNIFIDKILNNYNLDAVFPMHDFPVRTKTNIKLVSWYADLQHKHYPEFFSRMQIYGRNARIRLILRNCDDMVVSSQDVLNDFARFFKLREGLKIYIIHFVSIIDNMDNTDIKELKTKYGLPDKYFMVSNQFHKHKNHKVLLLALAKLKKMGINANMAFTGKFPSAAQSEYLSELHRIIKDHNLKDHVTMLGVISRSDQLEIMKHSQAVLQPSLFEGWSTVIEDAKSLQVPVIASDLEVNIEQLGKEGRFFNPHDPDQLASILSTYPERNINNVFYEDYQVRIRKAARDLLSVFTK
jgi:glycosyltransferase involved in cell wall biosynthesis